MLILTCPSPLITAPTFTYTLLDQFTTDQAAPLGTPRTAQPGPGSWTIVDANSKFSISSSRLVIPGGFALNDRLVSASFARAAGRAFLWEHPTHSVQSSAWREGWFTNGTTGTTPELGIQLSTNNQSVVLRNQGTSFDTVVVGSSEHCFAMVMRGTGGYLMTRNGMSGNYRLEWVHNAGTTSMFAKGIAAATNAMTLTGDNYRVTDLGGIWATDYGPATSRLVSPSAGATATSEASHLFEITFTWEGPLYEFWLNRTDANNGIRYQVQTDGSLVVDNITGGVVQNIGSSGAGQVPQFTSTRMTVIRTPGTDWRVFANVAKILDLGSNNQQPTATGVYLANAAFEAVCWPRFFNLQGA